jgi:hypothetical protein
MPLAAHLLNAFASTLLIALVTRLVLGRLAPRLPAAFGGFMLAFGYAIARYTGNAPFGGETDALVMRGIGTLAGLTVLWLWWFRRRPATA